VPALSGGGEIDSLLRLSRAIGLPTALPDILGFALRLHDLHGPGCPQDLLLASSPAPPMHAMLAPARSFKRAWCFDPILNAAPAFRQDAGVLDAVRAKAYRASRAGRSG
jgi:hypothetical protein